MLATIRKQKFSRPRKKCGAFGFSLLEISVVLIIISTIIGVGVAYLGLSVEKAQRDTTTQRMQAIQKALLDYRRAFNVIPCPSDITLAVTNTDFGRGNLTNPCTAGSTDPNFNTGDLWGGGVPVRTLKLPDDFAFDGWGRRFTYFADDDVTAASATNGFNYYAIEGDVTATPPCTAGAAPNYYAVDASGKLCWVGDIIINDITGTAINSRTLYVLISHGPNGHGGYTRYGTARVNTQSSNANEQSNCGCNASAVTTGYDSIFVQGPMTIDTADSRNNFDDIVVYGTRRSLRHVTE